jgi:hypothetical protein
MKKRVGGLCCILSVFCLTIVSWKPANVIKSTTTTPSGAIELLQKYVDNIYESAHLQDSGLAIDVFKKAMTGFINLKQTNMLPQSSSVLTVVDFSLPSREKRMWIIDIANKSLVLHTWVAHGERSGFDIPDRFSDRVDSRESSLGFYLTDNVYMGDHGRSLKLDGLDEGFNINARKRSIVLHAAPYVCQEVIDQHGRLGRSFGCPAVSPDVIDEVIDTIKDKNVIFISGNNDRYHSKYLDEELAASYIAGAANSNLTASL